MEEALRRLGKAGAHPRHCTSLVLRRIPSVSLIVLTDIPRSVHWKLQSRIDSALSFAYSFQESGLITSLSRLGLGAVIPPPPPPPLPAPIRKLKCIIYASKWPKQERIPAASALVLDSSRFP